LTVLAPEVLVLVADRKLTRGDGTMVDDEACKLVQLRNEAVFAFTGLANVRPGGGPTTDVWLLNLLNTDPPLPLDETARLIRDEATRTWARITHVGPRSKAVAIVATGIPPILRSPEHLRR